MKHDFLIQNLEVLNILWSLTTSLPMFEHQDNT
jgi:hypothetical protein